MYSYKFCLSAVAAFWQGHSVAIKPTKTLEERGSIVIESVNEPFTTEADFKELGNPSPPYLVRTDVRFGKSGDRFIESKSTLYSCY